MALSLMPVQCDLHQAARALILNKRQKGESYFHWNVPVDLPAFVSSGVVLPFAKRFTAQTMNMSCVSDAQVHLVRGTSNDIL